MTLIDLAPWYSNILLEKLDRTGRHYIRDVFDEIGVFTEVDPPSFAVFLVHILMQVHARH